MLYLTLFFLLVSLLLNIFLLISLKRAFNQIDILEEWLVEFKFLLNNTYKKLKNIDERGMFEKDDDVGIIFKNIIEIINLTNKRIQIDADDKQFNFDEKDKK